MKRHLFSELKEGIESLQAEREGRAQLRRVFVQSVRETPSMYFAPLVRVWRAIKSLA